MEIKPEEAKSKMNELASCAIEDFMQLTNISQKEFKKCSFHYINVHQNERERINENNKKEYKALKELNDNFEKLHIHETEMPNKTVKRDMNIPR